MTVSGRIRFLIGIIATLGLIGSLVLLLNANMSRIASEKAEIGYDSYTVGTPYPGVIVEQYAHVGESVKENDLLFEVQSPTLTDDLAKDRASADSFDLSPQGFLQIRAANDGIISKVAFTEGSYVSGSLDIATISIENTAYVEGEFLLSPPDYSRVVEGSRIDVLLPNNQLIKATVIDTTVRNEDNKAVTVVRAKLDQKLESTAFANETPVQATLHLGGKTVIDNTVDFIKNLFTPGS